MLEVLSGLRSPSEAASAMGVAVNRYYQLETRALQGVVDALEPRPRGRQRKPEDEIEVLKKEAARVKNELSRTTALLRSTQRSLGLPAVKKQQPEEPGGKKRRRRKPVVRALKHLSHLKKEAGAETDTETGTELETASEAGA